MNSRKTSEASDGDRRPEGNAESVDRRRNVLAPPMRRQVGIGAGLCPAQQLVQVALDHLQLRRPAGRGAMDALETQRQAGMHQLEQGVIGRRIGLGAFELLEEAHAAGALAKELREHAVLRPVVPLLARNVLHDVVGGGAERVLGLAGLGLGHARATHLLLELLDRIGDLAHQVGEVGAHQRDAQPSEQEQDGAGRFQQNVLVGRDRDVALEDEGLLARILEGRLHRRGADPILCAGGAGCRRRGRIRRPQVGWGLVRLRRIGGGGGRRRGWRSRSAPARIGADDGAIASLERRVAHRRSPRTAHNSSSSSGQSPEKCMAMACAELKSGQRGELRSRRK